MHKTFSVTPGITQGIAGDPILFKPGFRKTGRPLAATRVLLSHARPSHLFSEVHQSPAPSQNCFTPLHYPWESLAIRSIQTRLWQNKQAAGGPPCFAFSCATFAFI